MLYIYLYLFTNILALSFVSFSLFIFFYFLKLVFKQVNVFPFIRLRPSLLQFQICIHKYMLETSVTLTYRCRKLPKALKEWPAFHALKRTVDDFNDMCPLLELMANKAMKPRHWQRIMEVLKHNFDLESENFCLKNILEAPLLKHKEDIEVNLYYCSCPLYRKSFYLEHQSIH